MKKFTLKQFKKIPFFKSSICSYSIKQKYSSLDKDKGNFKTTADLFKSAKAHPVPQIKAIDEMVKHIQQSAILPDLSRTYVIGVQHFLESTATLFEAFIKLGVKPQNIRFTGKPYSDSEAVIKSIRNMGINVESSSSQLKLGQYHQYSMSKIKKMWVNAKKDLAHNDIDKLIVLDEGGRTLELMPKNLTYEYQIEAIEQTRGGLYSAILSNLPFRVTEVASSAIKTRLESPLIAEVVCIKLMALIQKYNFSNDTVFGIIGNGAIGLNVTKMLLKKGFKVGVYDVNSVHYKELMLQDYPDLRLYETLVELIANADCVIGCTGKNINVDHELLTTPRVFISATSEDKEFKPLLSWLADNLNVSGTNKFLKINPLDDLIFYSSSGCENTIVRGGFPVNFDKSPISVATDKIALTRLLLLGAFVQAAIQLDKKDNNIPNSNNNRVMLNPYIQKYALNLWHDNLTDKVFDKKMISKFSNIDFLIENSCVSNIKPPVYRSNKKLTTSFELKKKIQQDVDLRLSKNTLT